MTTSVKAVKSKSTQLPTIPLLEPARNYSVPEGAVAVNAHPVTLWRAIQHGHLETYRIGRRRGCVWLSAQSLA